MSRVWPAGGTSLKSFTLSARCRIIAALSVITEPSGMISVALGNSALGALLSQPMSSHETSTILSGSFLNPNTASTIIEPPPLAA